MIFGIGVDTVEHDRVARALEQPCFAHRVFSEQELAMPLKSIAARWAAREAAVKALGGLHQLRLRDLEVSRQVLGMPYFRGGKALDETLNKLGIARLHLSLTHDRTCATAFVVAERTDLVTAQTGQFDD